MWPGRLTIMHEKQHQAVMTTMLTAQLTSVCAAYFQAKLLGDEGCGCPICISRLHHPRVDAVCRSCRRLSQQLAQEHCRQCCNLVTVQ